jgi:hypothetical protein
VFQKIEEDGNLLLGQAQEMLLPHVPFLADEGFRVRGGGGREREAEEWHSLKPDGRDTLCQVFAFYTWRVGKNSPFSLALLLIISFFVFLPVGGKREKKTSLPKNFRLALLVIFPNFPFLIFSRGEERAKKNSS